MPAARSSRGRALGRSPWRREQQTNRPRGKHQTSGVSHRLGNPEPFVPNDATFGEHAQFGMAPGEVGTGGHGGQEHLAEALMTSRIAEGCRSLSVAVDRPTIVALGLVSLAEIVVR